MSEENTAVETAPIEKTKVEQPEVEQPSIFDRHPGFKDATVEEVLIDREKVMSEAKTRRLEAKALNEKLAEYEKNAELQKQASLEKNQEWEKAYNELKEKTENYEELSQFKQKQLDSCKEKIEKIIPTMSKAEVELFELSANGRTYDDQLKIIQKMTETKTETSPVDTSKSAFRADGKAYTKEELLENPTLMKEVKEKNPSLYEKFFGMFK